MDRINYELAAEIEANISGEASAREGYFDLIRKMPIEDRPIVEEIIADEMNHSLKLKSLVEKYSGIKPLKD